MEKVRDIIVKAVDQNKRIDVFLSGELAITRSQISKLIDDGSILINNSRTKSGHRIKADDRISVKLPEPGPIEAQPEDIPLNIVYEDKDIIVVNKPRGIVVHPSAGHAGATLVNALLHHCKDLSGVGGKLRPGVVHRLDKDTSGLIVFAKNDAAHLELSRQFKDRSVKKTYLALVRGEVKNATGSIDAPLGRHPVNRKKIAVIESDRYKKREARTDYKVIKRFNGYTLLELDLHTGRTHQIRVHLAHIGYPVVGDQVYSRKNDELKFSGQLLHAAKLSFDHPVTGKRLEFCAEMPEDMKEAIESISRG